MRIFNKNITIFHFLPYIFLCIWRKYSPEHSQEKEPEWKKWQYKSVPICQYINPVFKSYSQFGEDIFLAELFRNQDGPGFYIDVGANHPKELNNTFRLYQNGWRGINIEPGLEMFNLLNEVRPDDLNLRIGLGNVAGLATFYEMDLHTLSTFNSDEALVEEYDKKQLSSKPIDVLTLNDIYSQYCENKVVDLINIDVEGNNLEVLEGNDWSKNRPKYILIEMHEAERMKIIPYLYQQGYFLIYDNSLNGIFADSGKMQSNKLPLSYEDCVMPI